MPAYCGLCIARDEKQGHQRDSGERKQVNSEGTAQTDENEFCQVCGRIEGALRPIPSGSNRDVTNKLKYLQTGHGKEYFNRNLQALLNKCSVKHYSMYSEKKASIL